MSDVRILRVKSNLARQAFRPGGVGFADAISRAETAIEANFPAYLATIDDLLGQLQALASAPRGRDSADYETVYRLAAGIIDVSICLPGRCMDEAARALCELCDRGLTAGKWDQQSVEIHVKVLHLLRYGGEKMSPEQRARVVGGLGKVTDRRLGEDAGKS